MITVRVKLFAVVRDIAGTGEERVHLPDDATATDVLEALAFRYPMLDEWKPYLRIAINRTYASPDDRVRDGDEVAVIPPVSGG